MCTAPPNRVIQIAVEESPAVSCMASKALRLKAPSDEGEIIQIRAVLFAANNNFKNSSTTGGRYFRLFIIPNQ